MTPQALAVERGIWAAINSGIHGVTASAFSSARLVARGRARGGEAARSFRNRSGCGALDRAGRRPGFSSARRRTHGFRTRQATRAGRRQLVGPPRIGTPGPRSGRVLRGHSRRVRSMTEGRMSPHARVCRRRCARDVLRKGAAGAARFSAHSAPAIDRRDIVCDIFQTVRCVQIVQIRGRYGRSDAAWTDLTPE
jgi:hypothetical protein